MTWTFDAVTMVVLLAATTIYGFGVRAARRYGGHRASFTAWRVVTYALGILSLVAALVSPLAAWSQVRFAAHMTQHEMLMLVAAPLLVMGQPLLAWFWALPPRWPRGTECSRITPTSIERRPSTRCSTRASAPESLVETPMRVVLFCHSLISDWNHGNAHFLRGIATELIARGHDLVAYEPRDGWSLTHLRETAGEAAITRFRAAFPALHPRPVDLATLPLDAALAGADLVLVHEWMPHGVVERIGRHRVQGGRYVLLFHDTHHRSVTDPEAMARYRLESYDGVLAFGNAIRERYVSLGWSRRAWTWHEAADTRTFKPRPHVPQGRDLVWIGNWGDDERSDELRSYLIGPVRELQLSATVHGVRYPATAIDELAAAGIEYAGWIANHEAPLAYARHRMTVHVPRGPYVRSLPGVPTIRVFEALACGIPLVTTGWHDQERLFRAGTDFLVADTPADMTRSLRMLRDDCAMRRELASHGLETIRRRHTCAHRVDELLSIVDSLRGVEREERALP